MIYKILLLMTLSISSSLASFQEVRIGKIDDYYKNKISTEELKKIITEIENTFESQLGKNIFDYSSNGKDIDILYVSPSKLEQRISRKIEHSIIKKEKINKIKNQYFPSIKIKIDTLKEEFKNQNNLVIKKTDELNQYVNNINKKKSLGQKEYFDVKNQITLEKKKIDLLIKEQKKIQKDIRRTTTKYNQKVKIYNNLVLQSNKLNSEIESMSLNLKKVKGKTFGQQNIVLKTYHKDGKEIKEKSTTTTMNRIEIYGFDSIKQLKVVLAHEIAHLVGIPHIEAKNALMNPILQENQEDNLTLTYYDIENFKKNF